MPQVGTFIVESLVAIGKSIFTKAFATTLTTTQLAVTGAVVLGGSIALLGSMTPKVPDLNALLNRGTNVRSPISSRKLIYGKAKVGGTYVFISEGNVNSDRKFLYLITALASHECQSIDNIYIGDEEVTLNGSGVVTSPSRYYPNSNQRAKFYTDMLGATTQTVGSEFSSNTDLTVNDHFKGITCLQALLTYDPEVYVSGIPPISAIVSGKNDIYDPRTTNTGWSDNPALCVANYLMSDLGLGLSTNDIDWTSVTTASNVCDELVNLDGGGTQKRYVCNGVVDTANDIKTNIEALLLSMAGFMVVEGGKYKIFAGEYRTPTLTITEDDLISGYQIQTKNRVSEQFNKVVGLYTSSETNYQPSNYPEITNASYVSADGQVLEKQLNLTFTDNSARCQQIAKIFLEKSRQQYQISLAVNLEKFTLSPGDTVMLTLPNLGFENKVFEVLEWKLGGEVSLGLELTLKETDTSVYNWSTSEQQDPIATPTLTPTYNTVVATPSFTLTQTEEVGTDGTTIPMIEVNITDPVDDKHVNLYLINYKESTESTYSEISVDREF
tara:strand:+ start:2179 stop:3840 length:1662 start_codon:yes stop_codon:yes gene_type:complete